MMFSMAKDCSSGFILPHSVSLLVHYALCSQLCTYSVNVLYIVNGRLVATHYPHHCLVSDWLDEELSRGVASACAPALHSAACSVDDLSRGGLFTSFHGIWQC